VLRNPFSRAKELFIMAGEKDPFRAAEAQAKQQQEERESEQAQGQQQQQPTTADFEAYDEEVSGKVKGIDGASATGPAA
jgi:hypothetical protein